MMATLDENIAALTAPFKQLGISTDTPLVTPADVDPPSNELDVDATALPLNVHPEAAQKFLKQLTEYQPQGMVETRWGRGFYSSSEEQAAFLVELIEGRPGERLEFSMGPLAIDTSDDPEEIAGLALAAKTFGIPLGHLTDFSFGVSFRYVVGVDLDIHQVAKLTPDGTSLGLGMYYMYCKTALLRKMADRAEDEILNHIVNRFEQGKMQSLIDDGTLKGATPRALDHQLTETSITHIRPFDDKGYIEPVSLTTQAVVRGDAALVPNLMTTFARVL